MRLGSPLLGLLAVGCFRTVHRPGCELDPEPVADDVEVAGVTGAALLARVVGARTATGAWDDGSAAQVAFAIERTADAEYVHTTPVDLVSRSVGLGALHLAIAVECSDYVRVPVALRTQTGDGALDIAVETSVDGPMSDPGDGFAVVVSGDVPLDRATVPDGADAVPADYDDTYAFIRVTFPSDGAPPEGTAGWGGSQETPDSSSTSAFYVLEW